LLAAHDSEASVAARRRSGIFPAAHRVAVLNAAVLYSVMATSVFGLRCLRSAEPRVRRIESTPVNVHPLFRPPHRPARAVQPVSDMNSLITCSATLPAYGYSLVVHPVPAGCRSRARSVFRDRRCHIDADPPASAADREPGPSRTWQAIRELLVLQARTAGFVLDATAILDPCGAVVRRDEFGNPARKNIPVDSSAVRASAVDDRWDCAEPMPVTKAAGSLIGRYYQPTGRCGARGQVGSDTIWPRFNQYVARAQASRRRSRSLRTPFPGCFVPAVIAIAIITFARVVLVSGPAPASPRCPLCRRIACGSLPPVRASAWPPRLVRSSGRETAPAPGCASCRPRLVNLAGARTRSC